MPSPHPYVLLRCDACDRLVEPSLRRVAATYAGTQSLHESARGDDDEAPVGAGLLVFSRGDDRRYEEPALCARCSVAIGVTALVRWAEEEEEG